MSWSDLTAEDYAALPACTLEGVGARLAGFFCVHGGLSPDISNWRAGDVILSQPFGLLPNPVERYQWLYRSTRDHRQWTHVGIYDGRGFVWDANPDLHVQETAVGNYVMRRRTVTVRRPLDLVLEPAILIDVLEELAKQRYDLAAFAGLLTRRLLPNAHQNVETRETDEQAVICSTFVERAFRHAASKSFFPNLTVVLPMDYAHSPSFTTLAVSWRRQVVRRAMIDFV